MKKKIVWGVAALFALVLISVIFVGSNLDSLVRRAVETYGTAVTKAQTTLGRVDISLASGTGTLKNFKLGNPEGFKTDKAMSFGEVSVEIDPSSIAGNGPIVLRKVLIDAPEITYEVAQNGDTNLQTLQKNIQAYTAALTKDNKAGAKETGKNEGQGRNLVIERLIISNGQVHLSHALLEGKKISVGLPTITMTNIGKEDKDGASPAEIAQRLLSKITDEAIQVGQSAVMKNVRDVGEQGIKAVKDAVDESGVGDAIGNLLGN
ncbi:MAG: hypothetical protein PHS57_07095 [Alphaproteobacteria bacterium]|nr:hypothetical protein [Alphaproteobacteria bacterium]